MSINDEDKPSRVIPITDVEPAVDKEDEGKEGPTLPTDPALEQAMQEAMESVGKREDKKKVSSLGSDMGQEERDNFQNRIRELHIKLMEKTKELEEAEDKLMRSQANLDNYRKRAQKEREEQFNYGNEEIAKAFLDALDNLDRAVKHAQSDPSSLIEGVDLTLKQMEQIFERFNIVPIEALGEKFDPAFHQAMAQEYVEGTEPGMVVAEHLRGFMLKDRLLRPSMVVVSSKPPEANDSQEPVSDTGE